MGRMGEPELRRGETWEEFVERRLNDRDAVDVKLSQAEPWEKDELEGELSQIWYDLECARAYTGQVDYAR